MNFEVLVLPELFSKLPSEVKNKIKSALKELFNYSQSTIAVKVQAPLQ